LKKPALERPLKAVLKPLNGLWKAFKRPF
jgi:hypothetical protein